MKLHHVATATTVLGCVAAIVAIMAGAPPLPTFLLGGLLTLALGLLAAGLRGADR